MSRPRQATSRGLVEQQSQQKEGQQPNLAARAGNWSANHRKTAIWGWLGFVVLCFLIGNAVGQKMIHGADQFSGEAGRAEHALYDSGLRPNDEHVLVQSTTLTVTDPAFRSTINDAVVRLRRTENVVNVASPLGGGAPISGDKHAALVDFDITGQRRAGQGPGDALPGHGRRGRGGAPPAHRGAVRGRQHQQGAEQHLHQRPAEGGVALPADHAADPDRRLRLAGRGAGAALDRDHLGDGGLGAGRPPQPPLPRGQQPLLGDPAGRARGRGGLLALLPAARARGARGRARASANRC